MTVQDSLLDMKTAASIHDGNKTLPNGTGPYLPAWTLFPIKTHQAPYNWNALAKDRPGMYQNIFDNIMVTFYLEELDVSIFIPLM